MIPQTLGRVYDAGKIAPIQCVKNAPLEDMRLKDSCFLLLILREGSARFSVGELTLEATAPAFVCFDECCDPILLAKHRLRCDAVYFSPAFLNVNITFTRLRSNAYREMALNHDLFLLHPFTDAQRFVFPIPDEHRERTEQLFSEMENELCLQSDWYWSCRSRSFFMELILILERAYGQLCRNERNLLSGSISDPHLKKAVLFIEARYTERLSLQEIAKASSINHTTLTRLFKQELQTTPMDYLWSYRLTVAKKFLEFTNLPVKEISVRCGFQTSQHFSRKFEERFQRSPSLFREEAVASRKKSL